VPTQKLLKPIPLRACLLQVISEHLLEFDAPRRVQHFGESFRKLRLDRVEFLQLAHVHLAKGVNVHVLSPWCGFELSLGYTPRGTRRVNESHRAVRPGGTGHNRSRVPAAAIPPQDERRGQLADDHESYARAQYMPSDMPIGPEIGHDLIQPSVSGLQRLIENI